MNNIYICISVFVKKIFNCISVFVVCVCVCVCVCMCVCVCVCVCVHAWTATDGGADANKPFKLYNSTDRGYKINHTALMYYSYYS